MKNVKSFQMEIIRSLAVMGREGTTRRLKVPLSMLIKAHIFNISIDVRLANVKHLPVKCTSRQCAACSTKKKATKNLMDVQNM